MAAGDVLKIVRTAQGKSLRVLGKKARVHFTVLNRIERGLPATHDQLRKIARGLRVTEKNFHRAIALSNEPRD